MCMGEFTWEQWGRTETPWPQRRGHRSSAWRLLCSAHIGSDAPGLIDTGQKHHMTWVTYQSKHTCAAQIQLFHLQYGCWGVCTDKYDAVLMSTTRFILLFSCQFMFEDVYTARMFIFLLLFLIDQSSIQISGKEKIILKLKICCAKQNAVPSSGTGPKLDWSPCSNQGFTDHYWPSVCVCVCAVTHLDLHQPPLQVLDDEGVLRRSLGLNCSQSQKKRE